MAWGNKFIAQRSWLESRDRIYHPAPGEPELQSLEVTLLLADTPIGIISSALLSPNKGFEELTIQLSLPLVITVELSSPMIKEESHNSMNSSRIQYLLSL